MKKKDLPLSPHLQIYKPQITSVLSIAHRITGFCLNFLLIFITVWIGCLALGEIYYEFIIKLFNDTDNTKNIAKKLKHFMKNAANFTGKGSL